MSKKQNPKEEKSLLHPRNKHHGRYDFKLLIETLPSLKSFVSKNDYDEYSIDFFNPNAVKALNKALLLHYYNLKDWKIPKGFLCSPVPGRVDYVHYIADLLAENNQTEIPRGNQIKFLDVGVGANCIYPILGHQEYGWSFVGVDIEEISITSATQILKSNPALNDAVELRLQKNPKDIFRGAIQAGEKFEVSMCNPPFHASAEEAASATKRKLKNLKSKGAETLNFGGQHNELWCEGGEINFLKNMIRQSKHHAENVTWFTTLVSKKENIRPLKVLLKKLEAKSFKVIPMGQGSKISRILVWSFVK
ncbi:23S rRNA (adenine(1618)-N(6))-methyltransferase RlmF [Flavicella sp.]|uniref:23S rRNA (adenine(1618)-N(6))-methyltransferase RlmF n=1 Tax=Flavicella sp. TaxID=2957742 RepID=UPI002614635E|nr:23S rRNA (adenine(1618)-N(6))-methyltransferase RlmF [Flavicella sp.]MDG1804709.1 23S rRNA (adenine(1618)-N(6))-methyltransferase RlmF [Flavicella sp.]